MKYSKLLLLSFSLIIVGCSGTNLFQKKIFVKEDIKKENIF